MKLLMFFVISSLIPFILAIIFGLYEHAKKKPIKEGRMLFLVLPGSLSFAALLYRTGYVNKALGTEADTWRPGFKMAMVIFVALIVWCFMLWFACIAIEDKLQRGRRGKTFEKEEMPALKRVLYDWEREERIRNGLPPQKGQAPFDWKGLEC